MLGVWISGFDSSWRLVRRSRILLIALIAFYAFGTPGTPLIAMWEIPTLEGLQAGLRQAWRLLIMISALALILAHLKREQLLAGIYGLMSPFKPIGLPLERITVRLWLTLQYAEAGSKAASLSERWEAALTPSHVQDATITLEIPAFALRDVLFMLGCGALLLGALSW